MAPSIVQYPINTTSLAPVITNWTPLIGYMIYQSSISGFFYYKLVVDVYAGTNTSGTLLAVIKQRRNGYSDDVSNNRARAFFDLRDIVNTQLVPTLYDQNDNNYPFASIHSIGDNTATLPFSASGSVTLGKTQIAPFTIQAYQNYSESASVSPGNVYTGAVTNTLYYVQASLPLTQARSDSGTYIQSTAFNVYTPRSSTRQFLSDATSDNTGSYGLSGYINKVRESDYHTVAFLNDFAQYDSGLHYIEIVYYDSSNAQINDKEYIANTSANGGMPPNDSSSITNATRLLYFGCGPKNLEEQSVEPDAQPSNNSGWAYYTIRGTSNNTGTITYKTATYNFVKEDGSCKGFVVRRLGWTNKVGGYDYYNFKMKSTMTIDIERDQYNKVLGTFNKSSWRYDDFDRGKTVRKVTAKRKEILNTDWMTEGDAEIIESCLLSNNIVLVQNAETDVEQPVLITDSSLVKKTVANNKMIQYTVNIEYANPYNTNS